MLEAARQQALSPDSLDWEKTPPFFWTLNCTRDKILELPTSFEDKTAITQLWECCESGPLAIIDSLHTSNLSVRKTVEYFQGYLINQFIMFLAYIQGPVVMFQGMFMVGENSEESSSQLGSVSF